MTIEEIKTMLAVDGVTSWYDHAPVGTLVPFVTFTCPANDNVYADNAVYQKVGNLRAVLYTTKKDPAMERKVENALTAAELPWRMTDEFNADEGVYLTIYESEVLLT